MQLFYVKFDQTHKKSEFSRFAIVAHNEADAIKQATSIGANPTIDAGPLLNIHQFRVHPVPFWSKYPHHILLSN